MNQKRLITILLLTFMLLYASNCALVSAQEAVDQQLANAFEAVSQAEEAGGDVSSLVADLNRAIEALEAAQRTGNASLIDEALTLINGVLDSAPIVAGEGAAAAQTRLLSTALTLVLLIVLGVAAYRYLPRLFWSLWIRGKRDWRVKA